MKIRDLSEWEKRKVTIKLRAKDFVNQIRSLIVRQKIILLLHVVTFIVIRTKKRLRDLEETELNQRQDDWRISLAHEMKSFGFLCIEMNVVKFLGERPTSLLFFRVVKTPYKRGLKTNAHRNRIAFNQSVAFLFICAGDGITDVRKR